MAEHTPARGCANVWSASKQISFRIAEKHSNNASTLILCLASDHKIEKHGVNESKTAVRISGGRQDTWSRNAMKIGANGTRLSRGVSHALTRLEPSISSQQMIEERSCQ